MNAGVTRAMTFAATLPEVFSALQEAARRAGLQFLSGDASQGTVVFTSGMFVLSAGEKVTARMEEVAPGTVQVTLSPGPTFGITGVAGRRGVGVDRLGEALGGLLPRIA